jgi:hypothetical protein
VGAKFAHVIRYRQNNFHEYTGGLPPIFRAHPMLLANGNYFIYNYSGFFLHAGAGIGLRHIKYDRFPDPPGGIQLHTSLESGFGIQFYILNRVTIRWRNTAAFGPFDGVFTSSGFLAGFYSFICQQRF